MRRLLPLALAATGISAIGGIGVEHAVIMFRVLVIAFGKNTVSRRGGVTSQDQIFLPDLMHIAPDLGLRTAAVYDPVSGRRAAFAGASPAS